MSPSYMGYLFQMDQDMAGTFLPTLSIWSQTHRELCPTQKIGIFLRSTFGFTKSNHFAFIDIDPFWPQGCATEISTILTVNFWIKTGDAFLCHHLARLVTLICLISNSCRNQIRITCTPLAPTLCRVQTCTAPIYYTSKPNYFTTLG